MSIRYSTLYLGTGDELPLGSLAASDELREVGHQVGNLLSRCYDLIICVVPL